MLARYDVDLLWTKTRASVWLALLFLLLKGAVTFVRIKWLESSSIQITIFNLGNRKSPFPPTAKELPNKAHVAKLLASLRPFTHQTKVKLLGVDITYIFVLVIF